MGFAASTLLANPAFAATLTVNTTADQSASAMECQGIPGDCSLRQAIHEAHAGDIVSLAASAVPYAVTLGQLELTKGITISGDGARRTEIMGNGGSRIFDASSLPAGATATISGLTIAGGSAGAGGALQFDSSGATVVLDGVTLSANTATSGEGGAIYSLSGTLEIESSTLGPGNVARGTGSAHSAAGGAIYNGGAAVTVATSTITGNAATAGGEGGAIFSASTTTLSFDTVAFNSATGSGAAGGDIDSVATAGAFTAADTIVADGSGGRTPDCSGAITSDGHNLTDAPGATGQASCGFTDPTDTVADARLGPLLSDGGQTDTLALAPGSPAVDAIPTSDPSCTGADERGVTRPQGAGCDLGALETSGSETAPQWSVAQDFLAPPDQANPSPDSHGDAGVWSYEQAPLATPQDPTTYSLLGNFSSNTCAADPQDYVWSAAAGTAPQLGFNGAPRTEVCGTATLPRSSLFMDPSADGWAVVGWTSPFDGTAEVAGSFESLDRTGGAGVRWFVDKDATKVKSGSDGVGGGASFQTSQTVKQGDTLYFIAGPAANGSAAHDATGLNLTITSLIAADLRLTAKASPNPLTLPGVVTDTFTVTNKGPSPSAAVTFSDPIPTGATLQSATPSQGTCSGTAALSCSLGSLASGAKATVTVVLRPGQAGMLSNAATVSSTTFDPATANNVASATGKVDPCPTTKSVDAVTVQADCIQRLGDGTFLATGNTSLSGGATIIDQATAAPAALIIEPAQHTVALAPEPDGSAATGTLEAGSAELVSGPLAIATKGTRDPVAGISGVALVSGIDSIPLSLSAWTFVNASAEVYVAPASAGGGVLVDGKLALALLGAGKFSGQVAVQVTPPGSINVISGAVALPNVAIPGTDWGLTGVHVGYKQATDTWSGGGGFTAPGVGGISINPLVIKRGKLDTIEIHYHANPPIVIVPAPIDLALDSADLGAFNLTNLDYSQPAGTAATKLASVPACIVSRNCKQGPPPPPPPKIAGDVVLSALGETLIGKASFTYLIDGGFTATGTISMEPPFSDTFPDVTQVTSALPSNGILNLANAQIQYTPAANLFTLSGSAVIGPPGAQFLKGAFFVGIQPPHFTGEGKLDLIVPSQSPILGGEDLGNVEALISDEAAAAQGTVKVCAPFGLGCLSQSLLVAYVYHDNRFHFEVDGGNINDYATVPQAAADSAASGRRTVRVPSGRQFAAFTIRSRRGFPDAELISPEIRGRHLHLTLTSSRRRGNHSGALASVSRRAHTESFLVVLPRGGLWAVKRLRGPRIVSVRVAVRRRTPVRAAPRAAPSDTGSLPRGTVSTDSIVNLHYRVPRAPRGTTVDIYCGTQPHGGGGILVDHGLPPSAHVPWTFAGLASGRYYFYAVVNRNGVPISIHYWPRPVDVVDPHAPPAPAGVSATGDSGQLLVSWQEVPGAASYAVTVTPAAGGPALQDAAPADQLGAAIDVPPGRWSVAVSTVDSQGTPSPPRSAKAVTVP